MMAGRTDSGRVNMPPIQPICRVFVLVLLTFLSACDTPKADCSLTMVAHMPLQVQDNLLVVPAGINGQWIALVVDSGAERTTISDATADRLGLPHDPRYRTRSVGVGGRTVAMDVSVDRFVLGGVHFPVDRIAVGGFTLKTPRGLDADGLLGADILLAFDMDIDLPGRQLTLYRARQCTEALPPWSQPAIEITGVGSRKDRLLVPIEVDGMSGMAILDTGASNNVIGADLARRLGLNAQSMAADRTVSQHGIGPQEASAYLHRFKQFRIGPVVQADPVIPVQLAEAGLGDALIGERFLLGRRVWLSFRNKQIFVSRRADDK